MAQYPFNFPEFVPGATNPSIWSPEKDTVKPKSPQRDSNNMSTLTSSELDEIRRRFEAARSFEDDDEYLPLAIHGNTPTPGYALPVKRTKPSMPPPPKGPKKMQPPSLKKTNTEPPPTLKKDPTAPSKVNKPSMLRQQQAQEWETTAEKVVKAMARDEKSKARQQIQMPGLDWEASADDETVGSRRSSAKRAREVSNPYAVQFPPLQESLMADEDEDRDGYWDGRCV